jgi:endonuclease YncB( thermonuclease family)
MTKVFFVIAVLFVSSVFAADSVTPLRTVDGDTVEVQLQTKVRLWLVDTPETKKVRKQQQWVSAEPYGQEAKQFTAQWLADNQDFTIEIKTIDSYGRLVVLLLSKDKCLNLELVKNGLARVQQQYARSRKQKAQLVPYLNAEQEARKNKLGIWSLQP